MLEAEAKRCHRARVSAEAVQNQLIKPIADSDAERQNFRVDLQRIKEAKAAEDKAYIEKLLTRLSGEHRHRVAAEVEVQRVSQEAERHNTRVLTIRDLAKANWAEAERYRADADDQKRALKSPKSFAKKSKATRQRSASSCPN